jgi:hypothetical protein
VTLYPVVKRYGESVARGAVCGRLLEAVALGVGMLSVLSIVTLRQDGAAAGTDVVSLVTANQALVVLHDWTFLVGPSLFLGIYSLLLAYLMYRSQLVPNPIAWLGLIGGPLVTLSAINVLSSGSTTRPPMSWPRSPRSRGTSAWASTSSARGSNPHHPSPRPLPPRWTCPQHSPSVEQTTL